PSQLGGDAAQNPKPRMFSVQIDRINNLAASSRITPIPPARRRKDEQGLMQAAMLRITAGKWARQVAVPYSQWPLPPVGEWLGPVVKIPGSIRGLQIQLGNSALPLPASLTVDRFEVVPYTGAKAEDRGALMRDFVSTVSVSDTKTGERDVAQAHMNSPIYFD